MEELVIVKQTTKLLIPNKEHKNFTETSELAPEGAKIYGNRVIVNGLRKGEPHIYKLFKIKDIEKYIYQNTIQNSINKMENISNTEGQEQIIAPKINGKLVMGAIAGIGIGYYLANHYNIEEKKKWIYATIGGFVAYIITQKILKTKIQLQNK